MFFHWQFFVGFPQLIEIGKKIYTFCAVLLKSTGMRATDCQSGSALDYKWTIVELCFFFFINSVQLDVAFQIIIVM